MKVNLKSLNNRAGSFHLGAQDAFGFAVRGRGRNWGHPGCELWHWWQMFDDVFCPLEDPFFGCSESRCWNSEGVQYYIFACSNTPIHGDPFEPPACELTPSSRCGELRRLFFNFFNQLLHLLHLLQLLHLLHLLLLIFTVDLNFHLARPCAGRLYDIFIGSSSWKPPFKSGESDGLHPSIAKTSNCTFLFVLVAARISCHTSLSLASTSSSSSGDGGPTTAVQGGWVSIVPPDTLLWVAQPGMIFHTDATPKKTHTQSMNPIGCFEDPAWTRFIPTSASLAFALAFSDSKTLF